MKTRLRAALLASSALGALAGCGDARLGRALVSEGSPPPAPPPPKCVRRRPSCELPRAPVLRTGAAPVDVELPPCVLPDQAALQTGLLLSSCELGGEALASLRELVNAELRSVRIALGPGQRLTLRESQLTSVAAVRALESEETQGDLFVSHSLVWGSRLEVDRVQLLSSSLTASTVDTQHLVGDDVLVRDADVATEAGTLAALDIRDSVLRGCQAGMLMVASGVKTSRLVCEGRLQIYSSAVDVSSVDGELELQTAAFADGVFGLTHPTRITGWSTQLSNNVLCEHVEGLEASAGALECNDCEGPLYDGEGDVCVDPVKQVGLVDNKCELLREPPTCDGFPEPRRPIETAAGTGF